MSQQTGDVLSSIQKRAKSGTLLASCEPEIQELMRQIDVLISAKQKEWAEKWVWLNSQLMEREKEVATLRQSLWLKDTQVEHSKHEVTRLRGQVTAGHADSDSLVLRLRAEVGQLTHKYEKLKAKSKHSAKPQSLPAKKSSEQIQQLREEKMALSAEVEELEKERVCLEEQVGLAQAERTTLQEKCTALEGEIKFCHSQLDQKDSLVAAIEQSSAVKIKQVEAQLRRSQELATSRHSSLSILKTERDRARREREQAMEEGKTLRVQLSSSEATVRKLEDRDSELRLQMNRSKEQIKALECQLLQRDKSIDLFQEKAQRNDELIRSLQTQHSQFVESAHLQEQLSHTHKQLQSQLSQEKRLREEIAKLQQKNDITKQEVAQWKAECSSKDESMTDQLKTLHYKHTVELKKLHSQITWLGEDKRLAVAKKEAQLTQCRARLTDYQQQTNWLQRRGRGGGDKSEGVDVGGVTGEVVMSEEEMMTFLDPYTNEGHTSLPLSSTTTSSSTSHSKHSLKRTNSNSSAHIIQSFLQEAEKVASIPNSTSSFIPSSLLHSEYLPPTHHPSTHHHSTLHPSSPHHSTPHPSTHHPSTHHPSTHHSSTAHPSTHHPSTHHHSTHHSSTSSLLDFAPLPQAHSSRAKDATTSYSNWSPPPTMGSERKTKTLFCDNNVQSGEGTGEEERGGRGGGGEIVGEIEPSGRGISLEWGGGGRGGDTQLEADPLSETLDGIVDHHFEQLDVSLQKLMNRHTDTHNYTTP